MVCTWRPGSGYRLLILATFAAATNASYHRHRNLDCTLSPARPRSIFESFVSRLPERRTPRRSFVRTIYGSFLAHSIFADPWPGPDLIDKNSHEIRQDDDKTVYSTLEEIGDDLPDHSPRFILLSYPLTLVRRVHKSLTRAATLTTAL